LPQHGPLPRIRRLGEGQAPHARKLIGFGMWRPCTPTSAEGVPRRRWIPAASATNWGSFRSSGVQKGGRWIFTVSQSPLTPWPFLHSYCEAGGSSYVVAIGAEFVATEKHLEGLFISFCLGECKSNFLENKGRFGAVCHLGHLLFQGMEGSDNLLPGTPGLHELNAMEDLARGDGTFSLLMRSYDSQVGLCWLWHGVCSFRR